MIKNVVITIFFFSSILSFYAQDIELADKHLKDKNYTSAIPIYNHAFSSDSLNKELNFKMGVCNFYLKDYDKAEAHLLKSSSTTSIELFRYKAAIAFAKMKFKKAINFYNAYKLIAGKKEFTNEQITSEVEKVKFAQLAIQNKRDVLIQNFKVNTAKTEETPQIIADESILYYVVNGEIYSIPKVANSFDTPKLLNKGINKTNNQKIAGISTDGHTMYLIRNGDIYETQMGLDDWEEPVKMGDNINSEYIESGVTISLDNKMLFFVSDRPNGFGGKDLYKVLRLPNGKWSRALNMGPIVNSDADEESPFIHSDKKTLYFSSKGHQNMGGFDVFKTTLENGNWSEPENLKYPINSVDDDLNYSLVASGKIAYLSSCRPDTKGSTDIYKVIVKDEFAQFHVLKAIINEGKPIAAKITLIDSESKKVHGIYKSNDNTGKFIMLIDPEKSYNIIIEATDFQSYTADLKFDVNSTDRINYQLEKK
jgi:tetratricopeptide (TPR) repeat protein